MRQWLASDQAGLALVAEILREVSSKKDSLARVDFTSQDGPLKATALQGEIKGLNRVVDLMVELANHEAGDEELP